MKILVNKICGSKVSDQKILVKNKFFKISFAFRPKKVVCQNKLKVQKNICSKVFLIQTNFWSKNSLGLIKVNGSKKNLRKKSG